MTESEARIFLNMSEGDDPFEAMEEVIFQYKKFFTSQAVIVSTFNAKLNKLKKIQEASIIFGFKPSEFNFSPDLCLAESEVIAIVFQSFQNIKSQLYLALHACENTSEIEQVVNVLLNFQMEYCSLWPEIKTVKEAVILSKEMNPMEIILDLKHIMDNGIVTFNDLASTNTIDTKSVGIESQRLYMLNKKNIEWKTTL